MNRNIKGPIYVGDPTQNYACEPNTLRALAGVRCRPLSLRQASPVGLNDFNPTVANTGVFLDVDHEGCLSQATAQWRCSGYDRTSITARRSESERGCSPVEREGVSRCPLAQSFYRIVGVITTLTNCPSLQG